MRVDARRSSGPEDASHSHDGEGIEFDVLLHTQ